MRNCTSIALNIDVEPDDRTYDPAQKPRWLGFEALLPEMARQRTQLAQATGAPVRFTWLLRLDHQVERTYGRPDWPLVQYRREIGELLAAGDEVGVHTHAWRWDAGQGVWIADHGDMAWVGRCVDDSLAAFQRAMGRAARVFKHGDRFLSNDVVERLDRAGVVCDVTLEPGRPAEKQMKAEEGATGSLPDMSRSPRIPYHPAPTDYLRPGVWRRRRLWMTPVTTGMAANPLTGSMEARPQTLLIGAPFAVVRQVFEAYLAAFSLPVAVGIARSDVMLDAFNKEQFRLFLNYLAEHPRRREFVFETPLDAVRRYEAALAKLGHSRRDEARFILATRFPKQRKADSIASQMLPRASEDHHRLSHELAVERSFSRSLAATVQKLRNRLTEIESSCVWRWLRRWRRWRARLSPVLAVGGLGLIGRLRKLASREGRRHLRHLAKLAFKKAYLWLEDEPVEIVSLSEVGVSRVRHGAVRSYGRWLADHSPRPADLVAYRAQLAEMKHRPQISILMPVFNPPLEYFRQAVQSVREQIYPDWQLCIADDASTDPDVRKVIADFAQADARITVAYRTENGHISAASNSALALATGEFCCLLDQDDLLAPDALYQMVAAINRQPDLDVVYSDEDKIDEKGEFRDPHFKPQWCPDTLLSGNYICHLLTARTELVRAIGGFRVGFEGAQDFDLVLRLVEQTKRIAHVPRILYHWRQHAASTAKTMAAKPYAAWAGVRAIEEALARRGESGAVEPHPEAEGQYSIRYDLQRRERVGIVIPTRDRADLLESCLRSLRLQTDYDNFEILVVDNGSREKKTFDLFREYSGRLKDGFAVLCDDGPFNFSRLVNRGVRAVGGDFVLLLNNDIEALEPTWLVRMLAQAQRPTVGCVGARLLYADGTVQHAGTMIGRDGTATHVFNRASPTAMVHGNRLQTVANYSAVTGACLMVRRSVFEQVEGFDEAFAVDFNDIDFCLRVREAGYHNLLVPEAELTHHESATRGRSEASPESSRRLAEETAVFRKRWPDYIACDPCFSPHLEPHDGDLRIVA